jgi:hypothetical protein
MKGRIQAVRIVLKNSECMPIVFVEAVGGTEPEKPVAVLQNTFDLIIG